MNSGRKFTGYRSYPVYLERVTNYMTHIKNRNESEDEKKDTDDFDNQQENEEVNYQHQQQSSYQQMNNGRNSNRPSSAQATRQQQQQQTAQMSQQGYNKMSARGSNQNLNPAFNNRDGSRTQGGDNYNKLFKQKDPIANKMQQNNYGDDEEVSAPPTPQGPRKVTSSDLRNKRQNILNHTYQGYSSGPKKSGPSYSVKLALSSGGYASDSQ